VNALCHRDYAIPGGAVNVAISLYYYLMIVKRMYIDAPASSAPVHVGGITKFTLALLVLGILILGIFQEPFLNRITSSLVQ